MKSITFVTRHPEYRSKKVTVSHDVDLDQLSPAAQFLADNILTTDNGDDLSLIYVIGPSPRERNAEPYEIAMMGRNFPGFADRPQIITWSWPMLRSNETPEAYFERQAAEMRRIGGRAIKALSGSQFDLSAIGTSPAEQIRAIRASTGLSQAAFAARYEIPRRTYEAWEMGERTPPRYVVSLLASAVLSSE